MISSALSVTLPKVQGSPVIDAFGPRGPVSTDGLAESAKLEGLTPFLRIPPFPGAKLNQFEELSGPEPDVEVIARLCREWRVGGRYWGAQPALPDAHVLVRSREALERAAQFDPSHIVLWEEEAVAPAPPGVMTIHGECDAWHMLSGASALVTEPGDEVRTIAALMDVPCLLSKSENDELVEDTVSACQLFGGAIRSGRLRNPFTGEPMRTEDAIELCGFWRRLIDSNRDFVGGLGFAFWKQSHVEPLLWGGSGAFQFLRTLPGMRADSSIAVWRTKTAAEILMALEQREIAVVEVEDGFLRSRGLGADCIPPLSITVDRSGVYFDPSSPSDLENLLETGEFDDALIERAGALRRLIVDAGVGKYERGVSPLDRPAGPRRHILVPGQVEDDRAVLSGGCGLVRNVDLLAAVRAQAPDAFILYKPHPDVVAGHRRGAVPEAECLRHADQIVGEVSIASLIAMVDEVHVNTSLAGFEALLRQKSVTTYGVPFYAGWGLTTDRGPVPARRSTRRTIDELVAASLLLYPRYLDPDTGLPCPAEVVVSSLCRGEERHPGLIVGLRRLQGKFMRRLRSLVQ